MKKFRGFYENVHKIINQKCVKPDEAYDRRHLKKKFKTADFCFYLSLILVLSLSYA
jgi:hypothetical protein